MNVLEETRLWQVSQLADSFSGLIFVSTDVTYIHAVYT